MTDENVEQPKKRHGGWPKGKPRGPRQATAPAPMFLAAPEPEAPIHVRLRLKGDSDVIEFRCEERAVENGFHVFTYPSERNRYYTTRREFAISEIKEIEITAARSQVRIPQIPPEFDDDFRNPRTDAGLLDVAGPRIHSVKDNAAKVLGEGSIKMDKLPNLTFGDSMG